MAWNFKETLFDILGGENTLDNPSAISQSKAPLRMAQAKNAYAPSNRHDLQTRPGIADVRATAINAAGIFTGMHYQGDLADRFLMSVSIVAGSHNIYQDSANPPAAVTGGTNFTIGQDNLVSMMNFTDGTTQGTVCMSRLRNVPQFIDLSGNRSDFSITGTLLPQFGEVFGQRALYGAPSVGGTVYGKRVYWSDIRDGNLITDLTTQFESLETEQGGDLRAIKKFSDICMVGLTNNIFLLAVSPAFIKPFTMRELPGGRYKGPASHQAVVNADSKLWWISEQVNLHSMNLDGSIKDHGDMIKPTLNSLDHARLKYAVAGYDAANDLIIFSVTEASGTKNERAIALNIKTGEVYPNWTLSINAMASRADSTSRRLIMGGYVGKFRNWDSSATGSADDATAVIDADIITPRHHLGVPTLVKLFAGVKVCFDKIGTEGVTVQYRLDDASDWTSFAESPYTVRGTAGDVDEKYFPLLKPGKYIQLRFRDTASGEVFRVQHYTIVWKLLHPGIGAIN